MQSLDGVPARYMLCAAGHATLCDPPGCQLVRMPCGCVLATARAHAMQDVLGKVLSPAEREDTIRTVITRRRHASARPGPA